MIDFPGLQRAGNREPKIVAAREGVAHCDYTDSLTTNAARFSRGELDACLADAGPFCDADSFHNDVEEL